MISMASTTQLTASSRMGIYDPIHQISMWDESFKGDISLDMISHMDIRINNKFEYSSDGSLEPSGNDQTSKNVVDKLFQRQRRLAQNREAARKSRLRKKAYVQKLETSKLKLVQLEQELVRAKQQGLYIGGSSGTGNSGLFGYVNPGIAAFEIEYGHWLEEQQKKNCELKNALEAHTSDADLRIAVESVLNHYYYLFHMKADAAKADVFYLISGVWRSFVERFFLWIGGFRPSELLNVLMPQIEPLADQQKVNVCNLRYSCQQAEDALSQGIDKLQQTVAQSIAMDSMGMVFAIDKLDALESFVNQADHLRQQTLQQLYRILTTRQAARALLALEDYFHRLRALSSLWAARSHDPPEF